MITEIHFAWLPDKVSVFVFKVHCPCLYFDIFVTFIECERLAVQQYDVEKKPTFSDPVFPIILLMTCSLKEVSRLQLDVILTLCLYVMLHSLNN